MVGTNALTERMPRHAKATMVVAALALAVALPATAFAAKGGGSTSTAAWISLATTDGAAVATSQPHLGADVRFASGYPTTTKNPWVSLSCYQGGVLVYGEGGSPTHDFVLGGASSDWAATGGAASCIAELGDLYWRGGKQYYTFLASTSFDAGS
jgi:hypothetical protein